MRYVALQKRHDTPMFMPNTEVVPNLMRYCFSQVQLEATVGAECGEVTDDFHEDKTPDGRLKAWRLPLHGPCGLDIGSVVGQGALLEGAMNVCGTSSPAWSRSLYPLPAVSCAFRADRSLRAFNLNSAVLPLQGRSYRTRMYAWQKVQLGGLPPDPGDAGISRPSVSVSLRPLHDRRYLAGATCREMTL